MRSAPAIVAFLLGMAAAAAVTMAPDATATTVLSGARLTVVSTLPPPNPLAGSAEWDPTNTTSVGGYATTSEISVAVGGGTAQRSFQLTVDAPTGAAFHVGSYDGDDVYGVRGHAYLTEGGSACDGVRYTIVDLASSGTTLTRLDLQFETTCTGASNLNATLFGELQLGEPAPAPGLVTGTRAFAWPNVPVGTVSAGVLPVWVRNTGSSSVAIGRAQFSGVNAQDFKVRSTTCGASLAAHASCSYLISFAPSAGGARTAQFTTAVAGHLASTLLSGTGPAGRTALYARSQPGDWVGGGRTYLLTDAQSQMQVLPHGSDEFDGWTFNGPSRWGVEIVNRKGPIVPGTYAVDNDARDGFWLVVTGEGHGCSDTTHSSVTVRQATFTADGAPSAFDAVFSQTCTDTPNASLSGEISYRATVGSQTPSAPFVIPSGVALSAGGHLANGEAGKAYTLAVVSSGPARLTDAAGRLLWSTPAAAARPYDRLAVRTNGTLAMRAVDGTVLWTAPATGPGVFLELQSNGDLVYYDASYRPVWHSGTAAPST